MELVKLDANLMHRNGAEKHHREVASNGACQPFPVTLHLKTINS